MKLPASLAVVARALAAACVVYAGAPAGPALAASDPGTARYRAWIGEMKASSKGPFSGISWFCKDGTVIVSVPGKGYSCAEHGGGVQHGQWSERTLALRADGYLLANVLASLDTTAVLSAAGEDETLQQVLLEQYLVAADDGWILRGARYYRGAFQMEDERRGARRLLRTMLLDPAWRTHRFALLRETARLLPHEAETATVARMRALSTSIAERDPAFARLRDKIHNAPAAADADAVRAHALKHRVPPPAAADYAQLAQAIGQVYRVDASTRVRALAPAVPDASLARALEEGAAHLGPDSDASARLAASAGLLVLVRERLDRFGVPGKMLDALDASLALEVEAYAAASSLAPALAAASRAERVRWLALCADALYGAGLLSKRERLNLAESFARLDGNTVALPVYAAEVAYLARAPQWADRGLRFHFGTTVERWAQIEPRAAAYFADRLRGSPLLFFGAVLATLQEDANRLAGVRHRLFGEAVASGLRAMNPGLARGVLRFADDKDLDPAAIYVLADTFADLPPVAGILTAGAGNPVSHVQLLARNLGIPNVLIDSARLQALRARAGQRVVLAVSPRGTVRLEPDTAAWDALFDARATPPDVLIHANTTQLDLARVHPLSLASLRAADSGRIVGPKAANLAELKRAYPAAVADGVVVPFGVFRQLLDQPLEPGGPSVWNWMNREYRALAAGHADAAGRGRAAAGFLARLREWIALRSPDAAFTQHLRRLMDETFGPDGSYGVFVRSDTNIEDLAGFSGAGLNLTVPNVVGFDNVLAAIAQVWASPFTDRAYGWRQAHMDDPAQVFPSVLLQRSVAVEKSGVMITRDVDTGEAATLSVAVNEGIGGAVSGQAAEDLRVDVRSGHVRLMARATAPSRRVLAPAGGLAREPASGVDYVLRKREINLLVELARDLARGHAGGDGPAPAMDVEFGFLQGRLALFQIRPYAENRRAQRNAYLVALDAERRDLAGRDLDMRERP